MDAAARSQTPADAPDEEPADELRGHLQSIFGLDDFRLMQREVIEDVLAGNDVLCVMPTGAGKSLCYQLPAAIRGGLAIVVSPLISLMENQVQQLRDEGIAATMLNSSVPADQVRQILDELRNGWEGLLYVAPERFGNAAFRRLAESLKPTLLAIDEAHCISQWGHDFRPEYQQLGDARRLLGDPPTIALTATATADVREDIVASLELRDPSIVVTGFDRPNLLYEARRSRSIRDKQEMLCRLVDKEQGSGVVYCATRKAVDEITALLAERFPNRPIMSYHAGMDPAARTQNQERFMATPRSVAVATNAFGMGINKPDIRFVLHYNLPGTMEAYYQEAGRAGRDGQVARCVLLFNYADRFTQEYFIGNITGADDADPDLIEAIKQRASEKLEAIIRYATTRRCRRQQILDYFGDEGTVGACKCDVCRTGDDDQDLELAKCDEETTTLVRQMLSAVARLNGRVGVGTVAEVLSGSDNDKVRRRGWENLSTFGLLSALKIKQIIAMLHRLIEAGLVRQAASEGDRRYPVVQLTSAGVSVMKGIQPPPSPLADLAPSRGKSSRRLAKAGDGVEPTILDPAGQQRFGRLKQVRTELAKEGRVPPYVVASDKTLRAIAHAAPTSAKELERVKGMGPAKVKQYGPALLAALNETDDETDAGPRFIPDPQEGAHSDPADEYPSRF